MGDILIKNGLRHQWHHGRVPTSIHLLRPHLLPEAQAHGARQDALARPWPARHPHSPTNRRSFPRRRAPSRRNGARLSDCVWSESVAAGAPDAQ
jgi:hypothetical protein